jgi:hypothetical protein
MRLRLSRIHVLIASALTMTYGLWILYKVIVEHSTHYLIGALLFVLAAVGAYLSKRWAAYLMLVLSVLLLLGYGYLFLVKLGAVQDAILSPYSSVRSALSAAACLVVAIYCAIVSYKYVGRDYPVA